MLPALRQLKRRLAAVHRGMLERPADGGPRRNLLAVLLVALHLAERQAERERGVGIRARSLESKPRVRDLGVGLLHRLVDFFFVDFSHRTRWRIDQAGQLDHGISGTLDGRTTA